MGGSPSSVRMPLRAWCHTGTSAGDLVVTEFAELLMVAFAAPGSLLLHGGFLTEDQADELARLLRGWVSGRRLERARAGDGRAVAEMRRQIHGTDELEGE